MLSSGTPQRGFFIMAKVSASSVPVIWRPKNLCISLSFLLTGLIPRRTVGPVSSVRLKNFFRQLCKRTRVGYLNMQLQNVHNILYVGRRDLFVNMQRFTAEIKQLLDLFLCLQQRNIQNSQNIKVLTYTFLQNSENTCIKRQRKHTYLCKILILHSNLRYWHAVNCDCQAQQNAQIESLHFSFATCASVMEAAVIQAACRAC